MPHVRDERSEGGPGSDSLPDIALPNPVDRVAIAPFQRKVMED